MTELIAEYQLIGKRVGEPTFAIRLAICKPEQSESMAPAWGCLVTVSPLNSKPLTIYGDGSFQALCLGIRHAMQMLQGFVEQGGSLEYENGESFDASVFGLSSSIKGA